MKHLKLYEDLFSSYLDKKTKFEKEHKKMLVILTKYIKANMENLKYPPSRDFKEVTDFNIDDEIFEDRLMYNYHVGLNDRGRYLKGHGVTRLTNDEFNEVEKYFENPDTYFDAKKYNL